MTTPIEIHIAVGAPLFSQRVTLDGVEFILVFDWNDRESRWYLTIQDITETNLAAGLKVIANWDLLRKFSNPNLPKGFLTAADLTNPNGDPPGYGELGQRVRLFYFPAS